MVTFRHVNLGQLFITSLMVFFITLPSVGLTRAAPGDMGIYRDTNNSHSLNNISYTPVPFNSTDREDSAFSKQLGDTYIEFQQDGFYLYGYMLQGGNLRTDFGTPTSVYNGRVMIYDGITTTEQLFGHSTGIRSDFLPYYSYNYGYGVGSFDQYDKIRVDNIRYNDSAAQTLQDSISSFWLLQLDDDWDRIILQGEDGISTTTTFKNANFDTVIENTNTTLFIHDASKKMSDIQIATPGYYLVVYNVGVDSATGVTSITSGLTLDSSSISSSYDSTPYLGSGYNVPSAATSNLSIIETTTDNQVLNLQWGATGATAYGSTLVDSMTGIAVIRIPNSTELLRVSRTVTDLAINSTSEIRVSYNNVLREDSSSFEYTASTGNTKILSAGEYLFSQGGRSIRSFNSTTKLTRCAYFYKESKAGDVALPIGRSGIFVWGGSTTNEGGSSSAGIYSFSVNDIISFRINDCGSDGIGDYLKTPFFGLNAANLDTMFDNSAPVVTNVTLNSGQDITLNEGTTKTVTWSATVTDSQGHFDIDKAFGKIYRSAYDSNCTPDNNNCYVDSSCTLSSCTGNSCTVECSADVYFHADPTDIDSPYPSEYWLAYIEASDIKGLVGTGTSPASTTDMLSLLAIEVDSDIVYGPLLAGDDTGSTNQSVLITNNGNRNLDIELKGDNLCSDYPTCSGYTLSVDNQEYARNTFTYGTGYSLTRTYQSVVAVLPKPTASPSNSSDTFYWGMGIPLNTAPASYNGQNYFSAIADQGIFITPI